MAYADVKIAQRVLRQHLDNAVSSDGDANSRTSLNVAPYFFVSTRLARKYPHLLESCLVLSFQQSAPGPLGDRWKKHKNENDSGRGCFEFSRNLGIVAASVTLLQIIGSSPQFTQRIIIHLLQPLMLAGLIVFFNLCYNYPAFFAIASVISVLILVRVLYDKWKSDKVHPEPEDDRQVDEFEGNEGTKTTRSGKLNSIRPADQTEPPRKTVKRAADIPVDSGREGGILKDQSDSNFNVSSDSSVNESLDSDDSSSPDDVSDEDIDPNEVADVIAKVAAASLRDRPKHITAPVAEECALFHIENLYHPLSPPALDEKAVKRAADMPVDSRRAGGILKEEGHQSDSNFSESSDNSLSKSSDSDDSSSPDEAI